MVLLLIQCYCYTVPLESMGLKLAVKVKNWKAACRKNLFPYKAAFHVLSVVVNERRLAASASLIGKETLKKRISNIES